MAEDTREPLDEEFNADEIHAHMRMTMALAFETVTAAMPTYFSSNNNTLDSDAPIQTWKARPTK